MTMAPTSLLLTGPSSSNQIYCVSRAFSGNYPSVGSFVRTRRAASRGRHCQGRARLTPSCPWVRVGVEKESGGVGDEQVLSSSYETGSIRCTRQGRCQQGRPGERVPLSQRRHHDGSTGRHLPIFSTQSLSRHTSMSRSGCYKGVSTLLAKARRLVLTARLGNWGQSVVTLLVFRGRSRVTCRGRRGWGGRIRDPGWQGRREG